MHREYIERSVYTYPPCGQVLCIERSQLSAFTCIIIIIEMLSSWGVEMGICEEWQSKSSP